MATLTKIFLIITFFISTIDLAWSLDTYYKCTTVTHGNHYPAGGRVCLELWEIYNKEGQTRRRLIDNRVSCRILNGYETHEARQSILADCQELIKSKNDYQELLDSVRQLVKKL